jgi:hypothetical protein
MKSGLIIYLVGGAQLPEDFDLASNCRNLGFHADRVELAGTRDGFSNVEEAWHHLVTKGYGNIQLLVVSAYETRLEHSHPPLRLDG